MLLGQPEQHHRVTPRAGTHWLLPAAGSCLSARGIAGRNCLQFHKYAKQCLTALKKLLSDVAHRANVILSPAQPGACLGCHLHPAAQSCSPVPRAQCQGSGGCWPWARTRLGSGAASCSHRDREEPGWSWVCWERCQAMT